MSLARVRISHVLDILWRKWKSLTLQFLRRISTWDPLLGILKNVGHVWEALPCRCSNCNGCVRLILFREGIRKRDFYPDFGPQNVIYIHFKQNSGYRGGSRGRVQGVRTPPPWYDLQFFNTTGILQKNINYVVYWCWSRARDECTPS